MLGSLSHEMEPEIPEKTVLGGVEKLEEVLSRDERDLLQHALE